MIVGVYSIGRRLRALENMVDTGTIGKRLIFLMDVWSVLQIEELCAFEENGPEIGPFPGEKEITQMNNHVTDSSIDIGDVTLQSGLRR
jgi:hypothetical protein